MRTCFLFALTAQVLMGCGAAAVHPQAVNFAVPDAGSLSIGEPHVLTAQLNPMQPVGATPSNGAIDVTFARRGHEGSVLAVDAASLRARSSSDYAYVGKDAAADMVAQRVLLADGGSLLVWTEGTVEWGHRAMAQLFGADGTPRSAPVVLSRTGMDVFGAPRAATVDGHRVVATFSATEGEGFELVAVPIEGL